MTRSNRSVSGFTLIELMMVLVVFAIILSVAVPSFRTMFANNQSIAVSEDFIAALNLARSEAIKRGKLVSICRTTNPDDAAPVCTNATGNWNTGFIVYLDTKTTEADTDTALGEIIKVYPSLVSQKAVISVKRNGVDVTFLRYGTLGVLAKNVNQPATIETSVTKCKGNNKRVTTVKLSGSISVAKQACT